MLVLNAALAGAHQVGPHAFAEVSLAQSEPVVAERSPDKPKDAPLYVSDFGRVGTADDTAVVQKALNAAPGRILNFAAATYTVGPLSVRSNSHIVLDPKVILKAKTGYGMNERLLQIVGVSNVTIDANHAHIKMLKNEYTKGEQRHGVVILTANNVTINDLHSADSGGDGFYIGSEDNVVPSTNITLNNCQADNNRRQGLSIVSVKNLWVNGGQYSNTAGTAPEFGIDLEPNSSSDWLENVNLKGVSTRGNAKGGIQLALASYGATMSKAISVNIIDWHSFGDGRNGALRFAYGPASAITGNIKIIGAKIENSAGRGVDFFALNENMPKISISKLTVINPGSSMAAPGNVDLSAVSLYTGQQKTTGVTGNISFDDCLFIDTRPVAKMYSGVYLGGTYAVNNVSFHNVKIQNAAAREYTMVGKNSNISIKNDPR